MMEGGKPVTGDWPGLSKCNGRHQTGPGCDLWNITPSMDQNWNGLESWYISLLTGKEMILCFFTLMLSDDHAKTM